MQASLQSDRVVSDKVVPQPAYRFGVTRAQSRRRGILFACYLLLWAIRVLAICLSYLIREPA